MSGFLPSQSLEGTAEGNNNSVLSRIYHEAPDDIIELIVLNVSNEYMFDYGWGRMTLLRLVCKRLMRVVESCAVRLIALHWRDITDTLPLFLRRCSRIEHITCLTLSLSSLEGCPSGLKSLNIHGRLLSSLEPLRGCIGLESLVIEYAPFIFDLSPLASCTMLKTLTLVCSSVLDVSVLSYMPLLEEVCLNKKNDRRSIKDLSPLIQWTRMRALDIGGNGNIEDISPLAQCTQLEKLKMRALLKITNLKPLSSLTKLKELNIDVVPAEDLTPLSACQNLEEIECRRIPLVTSLLPLTLCSKLKKLTCEIIAKDLNLLKERRTDISFSHDYC